MSTMVDTLPRRAHWQIALGGAGYAEALDDLRQAIAIILLTRKGSDPLRPAFGSDIWRYIDHPIDRARPHLVREVVEAIRRWEPRVKVERVTVTLDEAHAIRIGIHFTTPDGVQASAEVRP
jgi:phage baseplate assembly protein W